MDCNIMRRREFSTMANTKYLPRAAPTSVMPGESHCDYLVPVEGSKTMAPCLQEIICDRMSITGVEIARYQRCWLQLCNNLSVTCVICPNPLWSYRCVRCQRLCAMSPLPHIEDSSYFASIRGVITIQASLSRHLSTPCTTLCIAKGGVIQTGDIVVLTVAITA